MTRQLVRCLTVLSLGVGAALVLSPPAGAQTKVTGGVRGKVVDEQGAGVPDVTGDSPGDARSRLEQAGLRADVRESGGLLDDLLPTDPSVCESKPAPGTRVDRGSTVRLRASKVC